MSDDADIDIEEIMVSLGVQRYNSAVVEAKKSGKLSRTKHANTLLGHATERVEMGLIEWIKEAKKKAGPNHHAVKFLTQLQPGQCALIACRLILDSVIEESKLEVSFARGIGLMLEHEAHLTVFKKEAKELYRSLLRSERHSNTAHKNQIFLSVARRTELAFEPWTAQNRAVVGLIMIELIVLWTTLLQRNRVIFKRRGKIKTEVMLAPTPETIQWLEDAHENYAAKLPVFLPTFDPPKDWSSNWDGGYHGLPLAFSGLMRAKAGTEFILEHLNMTETPMVLDGINTLQLTPWRINPQLYKVLKGYWDNSGRVAGLPDREDEALPQKIEGMKDNPEVLKAWKKSAAVVYMRNAKRVGKRMLAAKTIASADLMGDRRFYFPHKMCFRGRAYPHPNFLQPQGADLAKGLLQFANGMLVGRHTKAASWLSLHAANCYGDDKLPIDQRSRWAETHRHLIVANGKHPDVHDWWMKADKPWKFLGVCMELAEMFTTGSVESHTPVELDGSNNGLQIFSLMLRDPIGGKATNCIASDKQEDLYQDVADEVTRKLKESKESWVIPWLIFLDEKFEGVLPRSAVKRPVMTLPYGSKINTCRDYVRDWYIETKDLSNKAEDPRLKTTYKLGTMVWDCIVEAVPLAVEAMEWLQDVARKSAKANLPMVWRTPVTNLMVGQQYMTTTYQTIDTMLSGGVRRQMRLAKDTTKTSVMKMRDAIAPNLVHSLDASAMYLTISKCQAQGVNDFCMIHDSFATHACNVQILFDATREAYAELFSGNFLDDWRNQVLPGLPEGTEIPPAPKQGTLDPNSVLKSNYFFL